jgi:hypothetical protein
MPGRVAADTPCREYLRGSFDSASRYHQMLTDRKHVFIEAASLKDVINIKHGQLACGMIGLHLQRVEWDRTVVRPAVSFTRSRRTPAEKAAARRNHGQVEFGRPVLKSSAVPTAVMRIALAGESIADRGLWRGPLNIEGRSLRAPARSA